MTFQKGNKLGLIHGHNSKKFRTRTYNSWAKMIGRCTNKHIDCWEYYGGRGITVCEEWMDYKKFLLDMGERPNGTSLDRINNKLGYFKDNCRWATKKQQQNNTRRNVLITVGGVTLNLKQWSEKTGISYPTLSGRIKTGWSHKEALNTPVIKYSGRAK